jgi:hypothetical protein
MSALRRAPEVDAARLRLRLAGLVLLSAVTVGFVGSGAAAQGVDELLGDDPTAQSGSTTPTAEAGGEGSGSVAPTSTDFVEESPESVSPPATATRSPTTTLLDEDDLDTEVLDEESSASTSVGSSIAEGDGADTEQSPVLVAGDGTAGSESTTTTPSEARVSVTSDDETFSEETILWMVVAGLVAVALLIGVWTIRYWRVTRPTTTGPPGPDDPTTVLP